MYRIEANTFDILKEELFASVLDAKRRIFQCVVIRYDTELWDAKRRTERLHEGRKMLKFNDLEKSLYTLNQGDLPF